MPLVIILFLIIFTPIVGLVVLSTPIAWLISTAISATVLVFTLYSFRYRWASLFAFIYTQLVNSAYFLSFYIQDSPFNARFFAHARWDILYAGISDFYPLILVIVTILILGCLLIWKANSNKMPVRSKVQGGSCLIALLTSLVFLSPTLDIISFAKQINSGSDASPKMAALIYDLKEPTALTLSSDHKKKNIVVLYLESIEQSFYNNKYYPGLLPELTKIQNRSTHFNHIVQAPEASWTIAGMVASQCGLPLHSPYGRSRNLNTVSDDFMSEAYCLGDALVDNGYQAHYMGGASVKFAGKGKFYRSHGYQSVEGIVELLKRVKNKKYRHGWGLYDDTLFKQVKERFLELSNQADPFILTTLTLDTHPPTGHASASCKPYPNNPSGNSMLNAIHCTDQLASKFINFIRSSDFSKNTSIIVMSDHLAMRNNIWEKISNYPKQRTISLFINEHKQQYLEINNEGTHYDIYATLLAHLGFSASKKNIGLGENLYKNNGYISQNELPVDVGSKPAIRNHVINLWDSNLGNITQGIKIEKGGKIVRVGDKEFNFASDGWGKATPSLFKIDPNTGKIENVETWSYSKNLKKSEFSKIIIQQPEKLFLAISTIDHIQGFHPDRLSTNKKTDSKNTDKKKKIAYLGSASSFYSFSEYLTSTKPISIDLSTIKKIMSTTLQADQRVIDFNQAQINSPQDLWKDIEKSYLLTGFDNVRKLRMQSCGLNACRSQFMTSKSKVPIRRGINIVGLDISGSARLIDYIDGCLPNAFLDKNLNKSLNSIDDVSAIILLSDDTSYCISEKDAFKQWASGSKFEALRNIEYRNPYIAFYDPANEKVIEFPFKKPVEGNGYIDIEFRKKKLYIDGTQKN